MTVKRRVPVVIALLASTVFACSLLDYFSGAGGGDGIGEVGPSPTPLLEMPVKPGESPNEPVIITGTIPFTSPFFLEGNAEPFVLLEDQAGFVARDEEFVFPLAGQAIGPVELIEDNLLSFSLTLPSVPQGTLQDLDNDNEQDRGVMVFAVAYWSNTWGGPFLEARDGRGWSSAYASTITDPDRDYEITGGHLVIWAPDDQQEISSGFGEDDMLFTEDDPTQPVPPGYSFLDLSEEPFRVYKEPNPEFELIEGSGAVKDYSDMSYGEAFDALFERVSIEYPFTDEKGIDWQALYDQFAPQVRDAQDASEFYNALKAFTLAIPDAHVGIDYEDLSEDFFVKHGGSFGLLLAELSDGRVIVTRVLPGLPGSQEGIQVGAEIIAWGGQPVSEALDEVEPYFGPYSTEHHKRLDQLVFLTRLPPDTTVEITYQNPGESAIEVILAAEIEYDSLFASIPFFSRDELAMPLDGEVLEDSGLGYVRIDTFSEDYNLMARVWERYVEGLIDNEVPGLIIDMRANGGGNGGLAMDFVGYFFDEEIVVSQRSYYNDLTGEFEPTEFPTRIEPGPLLYEGLIAVLVSPNCISACEGFTYAMTIDGRSIIVGHFPTAGAYGEVGQGQYDLPEGISMQFPTGRPETPDGELLIEGVGVVPDVSVPVTEESALGQEDAVLQAAIDALLDQLQ